jgi:hypothetical protein
MDSNINENMSVFMKIGWFIKNQLVPIKTNQILRKFKKPETGKSSEKLEKMSKNHKTRPVYYFPFKI